MPNPFSFAQKQPGVGTGNPMMTSPRTPDFKDAQTTYGGGGVNTRTMGLNPYVQFQPNRMDQLFAMLGQRRQPQQQMQQSAPSAPRPVAANPQAQTEREEWVDVPAMNRLGFSVGSATTRVKKDSQAARQTGMGVVGY